MSNENEYFIVSTNGFGGPLFRVSQKYIESGQKVPMMPQERGVVGSIFVTKTLVQSTTGEQLNITARDKNSKAIVEVSLIKPTDKDDYREFVSSRNLEIDTTDLPPVKFALATLAQVLMQENQEQSPVEKFKNIMIDESLFPFQNIEEAITRLERKFRQGLPFKMGCFVCLNTKCTTRNGLPVFYLGQDEKRLTSPKLMRRTQQLISLLDGTSVPYNIDILIADTDIYDVNGDWLANPDQSGDIYAYRQKLSAIFSNISPNFDCKLWSEVQAPYEDQYRSDFNYVLNQYADSNEDEVWANIAKRKSSLISQGVPDSYELGKVCRTTAERNFALYAAQGPILNEKYGLVIMADPEPDRLSEKQSLLSKILPIWKPYSG
jgi:hypothetical protein